MNTRSRRAVAAIVAVSVLAACRPVATAAPVILPPPPLPVPSVASRWTATQAAVLQLVAENRTTAADSALLRFAREHPRTTEGDRARWWRTLMRADPRQTNSDPSNAIAQLDTLLSDSVAIEVRAEAVLMRRTVSALDSLRRLEVRRRVQATQVASDRMDELKVARDSMARLSAEIARLRKRLNAP